MNPPGCAFPTISLIADDVARHPHLDRAAPSGRHADDDPREERSVRAEKPECEVCRGVAQALQRDEAGDGGREGVVGSPAMGETGGQAEAEMAGADGLDDDGQSRASYIEGETQRTQAMARSMSPRWTGPQVPS